MRIEVPIRDSHHLADIHKAVVTWGKGMFVDSNVRTLERLAAVCRDGNLQPLYGVQGSS